MSRYSYAGDFKNPTEHMRVGCRELESGEFQWFIECHTVTNEMVINCVRNSAFEEAQQLQTVIDNNGGWTPHTKGMVFEEPDLADEWLDNLRERFEQDYDQYLEENRYELNRMERYEQWRNEY